MKLPLFDADRGRGHANGPKRYSGKRVEGRGLHKITAMRAQVVAFLSQLMAAGTLRPDDAQLAADPLRGLLEAEIMEPLLLHARDDTPDDKEIAVAADRAIAAFIRAYAPDGK